MTTTHITEEMRAAVGTEVGRAVSHPVSDNDIRRWAIAVYWPEDPPARFTEGEGLTAPEEFNAFAWSAASRIPPPAQRGEFDPDSTEKLAGVDGPGLKRILNGGMKVTYGAPIRAGDVITSVRTLGEYAEREGRLGLMLFSTTDDTWTNQRGELVKRTSMTLIRY